LSIAQLISRSINPMVDSNHALERKTVHWLIGMKKSLQIPRKRF